MMEADWLACVNPLKMLEVFRDNRRYDRKVRLFAVACCRRIWHLLDQWGHDALGLAERLSDARSTQEDVDFWLRNRTIPSEVWRSGRTDPQAYGVRAAGCTVGPGKAVHSAQDAMRLAQAAMLAASGEMDTLPPSGRRVRERGYRDSWVAIIRCVFGNPFRPAGDDPSCRTTCVLSLAQAAYEERILPSGHLDNARLAVLSDALEEAGCADEAVLSHLRSPGPHVRGCWALDLVLGKE